MTEYGRGPGPEPWHPEDPLYGDQGWAGGYDTAAGQSGPDGTYGGQQYGAQPGQQPSYEQQPQTGGWEATGQYYAPGAYGQQPTPGPYDTGGHPAPYGGQDAYPQPPQHHTQPYPQAHPHPQAQPHSPAQPQVHPQQPYQGQPQHHTQPQQRLEEQPEPQPAPVRTRHRAAGPGPEPDPETGWDPGPDQGEESFFTRREDEDDDEPRGRAERRSGRPRKQRGGCGCLVLALVLTGGVGGAGFYGYQLYQDRFGPAPDYSGEGSGDVQVEIPQGSTISDMGTILQEAGVVKSHDAFVDAAGQDGQQIQAGIYTLRQEMSAESAVTMLLDPSAAAVNALTIPEGLRATAIFALIDERLGLPEGETEDIAGTADLGLPGWAGGEVEGFLFPARYDVGDDTTPEDLLTEMVDRAEREFDSIDLAGQAEEIDRTPREVLTIASLIQAEAQEDPEFPRVSRVVHNRLDQDMRLEFDSTINYAMGRSTLDVSIEDTQLDSPYNTYVEFGLPPGPIGNPGHQAIEAALNPADGTWLYFVTVAPGDTRFTDDYDEHLQNVEDFNAARGNG